MASEKIVKFVEEIKTLTVLELNELVKAIEEEFGVSAAAPVMVAAGPAAAAESEKTEFDIHLVSAGEKKMDVIKLVKDIVGVGLKEAKELVDGAPKVLKEAVSSTEAEEVKAKLEAAGAKIELK